MGICNIDHTQEDVLKKLESQEEFLPIEIREQLRNFLNEAQIQETLNDIFHLLKKYDLATKEEQHKRNEKLVQYLK